MKKIPTLFVRKFENHKVVDITPEITPGCEEAFKNGVATIKYDGSCCAIINGEFYKRYDAKKGKNPPVGAIPCCEPDPITGHWPHWVPIDKNNPADKWFVEVYKTTNLFAFNRTYEVIGPHFQGNPYGLAEDRLIKHGEMPVIVKRDFESIKRYLTDNCIEGLVFWLDGKPVCKIKRSDFGLPWPKK